MHLFVIRFAPTQRQRSKKRARGVRFTSASLTTGAAVGSAAVLEILITQLRLVFPSSEKRINLHTKSAPAIAVFFYLSGCARSLGCHATPFIRIFSSYVCRMCTFFPVGSIARGKGKRKGLVQCYFGAYHIARHRAKLREYVSFFLRHIQRLEMAQGFPTLIFIIRWTAISFQNLK